MMVFLFQILQLQSEGDLKPDTLLISGLGLRVQFKALLKHETHSLRPL